MHVCSNYASKYDTVLDMGNFVQKDHNWAIDRKNIYYLGIDVPSFICGYDYVESQPFAFDKNRYYQGTPNPRLEQLRQSK